MWFYFLVMWRFMLRFREICSLQRCLTPIYEYNRPKSILLMCFPFLFLGGNQRGIYIYIFSYFHVYIYIYFLYIILFLHIKFYTYILYTWHTYIYLWPTVYCWWPCETPEVEQLKMEMDPWLLVVFSGCNCWGWSTRLRQIQTRVIGWIFEVIFMLFLCLVQLYLGWSYSIRRSVFWLTGGWWVEHGWNKIETNGRWTFFFCAPLSLAACLSRSIVGSLNVPWWVLGLKSLVQTTFGVHALLDSEDAGSVSYAKQVTCWCLPWGTEAACQHCEEPRAAGLETGCYKCCSLWPCGDWLSPRNLLFQSVFPC